MRVTEEYINQLVAQSKIESTKMGQKTTVVHLTLPNGFELVESAACVDPNEYNQAIGEKVALDRIKDKIWLIEGYLLHLNGVE